MASKETDITPLSAKDLGEKLSELIPLTIGGSEFALREILKKTGNQTILKTFAEDDSAQVLVIARNVPDKSDGDEDGADDADATGEDSKPAAEYEVLTKADYSNPKQALTVLIKRANQALAASVPLGEQTRIMTFDEGVPFEALQSFVSKAIEPYLSSAVRKDRPADEAGVKSALAGLAVQLQQLQQNIDIPEVNLVIHPRIKAVCDKASGESREARVEEFSDADVQESAFLNQLQKGVAKWIKEIHKVTKIERDPATGTAMQEVKFWLNLEAALQAVDAKRQSPGVKLTMELLKQGNRHLATTGMQSDTGMSEMLAVVEDYSPLMKDFAPLLNGLLTASDTYTIQSELVNIFSHLKKIKATKYKVPRALKLIQAISRDLDDRLRDYLDKQYLMHKSYEQFEKIIEGCEAVFLRWEEEDEKFRNILREIIKRRRDDMKTFRRVTPQHKKLQERLASVAKFRKEHEQLQTVIGRVLRSSKGDDGQGLLAADDAGAIEEVKEAYEDVKSTDVLDLSAGGDAQWLSTQKKYEERIDRVEQKITSKLRDQLGTAKNANEMFRIFGKFNALLVRPSIRGAIREYQTQLIERVRADINALQDKFKTQYKGTMVAKMSEVRDLPEVSGQIIWAKQIDRQLGEYLKRVEDVLGKDWKQHAEGRVLKEDGDSFQAKLNTQTLFDKWSAEVTKRQLGANGRIFDIELRRGSSQGSSGQLVLSVNFHPQIITISKEVRNLKWLGFRVPLVIVNKALQASHLYPYAISLKASVRTYQQTYDKLQRTPNVTSLVASFHKAIQTSIAEGVTLRWESYRLEMYVQQLAEKVFLFQEKVDDILDFNRELKGYLAELETCKLDRETFSGILEKIQSVVDSLNLKSYTNLDNWVKELDQKVEEKLKGRLTKAITLWLVSLDQFDVEKDSQWDARDTGLSKDSIAIADLPNIVSSVHEITIRNQVMVLNPPVERARENLYEQLQTFVAIITDLPRIQASKYVMGNEVNELNKSLLTYRTLLSGSAKADKLSIDMLKAYKLIESKMGDVNGYAQTWLRYQALWDLQVDMVVNKLGEDLSNWHPLLIEIKKARAMIDVSENTKEFGPVVINFSQVQNRVISRYDDLHKEILKRFGLRLKESMGDFYVAINKARSDLEMTSIDSASTQESVGLITMIQELKRKQAAWQTDLETYESGEKVLRQQRYQFPKDWRDVDNITGEWDAFCEILGRKDRQLQEQMPALQLKVVSESRALDQKLTDLLRDWNKNKPVGGKIDPDEAMDTLNIYEGRFAVLKTETDMLATAKAALDIDSRLDDQLEPAIEELQDLKSSWSELSKIFAKIKLLKDLAWKDVVPKQIKKSLEDIIKDMKNLPPRVRSYSSYESTLAQVENYKSVNKTVEALKGDGLKDRHWRDIMKGTRAPFSMFEMTLGKLWDLDLVLNKGIIDGVVRTAVGEMALEKFLQQTREEWNGYELELVNYQNKTKLIKGWIELFDKCRERLASLAAMKLSPYYRVFQEEAQSWDDKLNKVAEIFEVWMDVQQRWVYLEGIFVGGADIKHLLPNESSRFDSISAEFKGLMKKVSVSPSAMDVINIGNVFKALTRLAELLQQIQKALGDYLEKERSAFPRFYFVGDDDLLEIIGNSKDVDKLQKHFRKLFAGVHSIILDDDEENVLGVMAKEGEKVMFTANVPVKGKKINIWLTNLVEEINVSLATQLAKSCKVLINIAKSFDTKHDEYMAWMDEIQCQLVVLTCQVQWSEAVDTALASGGGPALQAVVDGVKSQLNFLADKVLLHQPPIRRRKLEHVITEMVHQRDVTRQLIEDQVTSNKDFRWLQQLRYYFDPKNEKVLEQLKIRIANAQFFYGFEYLGLIDRLVQTPLTDRAYMTLTQALMARQGGAPFGPAGTGKTESVKSLGAQLGRFVLVFNCDETFDSQAMQRILVGLCQVGAWGCFDEFNRLEEAQLSAVSQQIQTIQMSLKKFVTGDEKVTVQVIAGKDPVPLSSDVGVFVTMNPGYAGRSLLPDNLKKLFRQLAMTAPDRKLIAQVMLYAQGFRSAEPLSKKIVPLFILCGEQLSSQSHYDFGLRALKQVLISAGNIKRLQLKAARDAMTSKGETIDEAEVAASIDEQTVLIQSVSETMVPKLVGDDITLLKSLMNDVFPGVKYTFSPLEGLTNKIREVCAERHLVASESFMTKILQLYGVTNLSHGLMMVGPPATGKSCSWSVLLEALRRFEGKSAHSFVIDPKAITKDELYGFLDPTTREWTDGIFTYILRKIIDNKLNELERRQWIIFDGDVDPEWVENLNSVLDDNKLLTLPNGERLAIPPNVRIMFEVQDLNNATLATVSRCGMIWYSDDIITNDMLYEQFLNELELTALETTDGSSDASLKIQKAVAACIRPYFAERGMVANAITVAAELSHVMAYSNARVLNSLFAMIKSICRRIFAYDADHPDFPMDSDQMEKFTTKQFLYSVLWCFAGDGDNKNRKLMSDHLKNAVNIPLPPLGDAGLIIDFEVTIEGDWKQWEVAEVDIEMDSGGGTNVVIPTLDTVRHRDLLYTWLSDHLPVVLCGPPGSGKTMTLFNALRALPDFVVVGLNFSSATGPELLMNTFLQHCEYRRTSNGVVLAPQQANKWLVIFCDECNLPQQDKYETVKVITFMRQLIVQGGFWRPDKQDFVKLERIQFVGACNPPTDPGRVPLTMRFLRHVPVVYVDYPSKQSYTQIYRAFNRALMKRQPDLKPYADPLTEAMVDFFLQTQDRFTADMQPFYIYSPREMTRWIKGIKEAMWPLDTLSVEGLVRMWAHEALRLFQDRLVADDEREWTEMKIDEVARAHFPSVDCDTALQRPILYSDWLSKEYGPVEREVLRDFVSSRLQKFHEEELDVPLVLFNEVLDHVLRIDRVFKQNQGHVLMIGISGSGKTTLSRFVAWINGLSVFQVKVHNKYTADDFDEDLRTVLRRSGTKGEKMVFIMDEGNVMDTAFLERINTLLANGEVPGLFEGDEYAALMTQCQEGSRREGVVLTGNDELYKWFSEQVMKNLHVVFTMNPASGGMQDRAATSPALFNRCVLDWFGDWSDDALFQVSTKFTEKVETDRADYQAPMAFPAVVDALRDPSHDIVTHREAVNNAFVFVHNSARAVTKKMIKRSGISTYITPRHYLECVEQFKKVYSEKRERLEEEQRHLTVGLEKIKDTFAQVEEQQKGLEEMNGILNKKNADANATLKIMVVEQQKAEAQKAESEKLDVVLQEKLVQVGERKGKVENSLADVEPQIAKAKAAVDNVDEKALKELRVLCSRNPPQTVKSVIEACVILLGDGKSVADWKAVRAVVAKDNFKTRIMEFDSATVTNKIATQLKKYTEGDLTVAKAMHASQAAGPLLEWAFAQIAYTTILVSIGPLRKELKTLEDDLATMQAQQDACVALIAELGASIDKLKTDYGELVGAAQGIKTELESTKTKVDRSVQLLGSLEGEKVRWTESAAGFEDQMKTLIGDSFLAAAFLAYSGYFDQNDRGLLERQWQKHVTDSGMLRDTTLDMGKYLSTPEMNLAWKRNQLPDDSLCTENAIMLERYIRYPLIIDPAGQAVAFVCNQYKDTKIVKTSFQNPNFRKELESALRFGTPLLVQDAELYDPILNPVLNREVKRANGRSIIQLGDQEIDMSMEPTIILAASDPSFFFSPDICSRVTMVNFTVTPASLHAQCLNRVLRSERPDVEEKRTNQLKLQGEFQAKLHTLEESLLSSLSQATGSLLDDNVVIGKLETIKKEWSEVKVQLAQSGDVMKEIQITSEQYEPLAARCSAIYFTLDQLFMVGNLYRYTLQFFLDIFKFVLTSNDNLKDTENQYEKRLEIVTRDLFIEVYRRVAPGMLDADREALALMLARLNIKGTDDDFDGAEFTTFLKGAGFGGDMGSFESLVPDIIRDKVGAAQANVLSKKHPAFSGLASAITADKAKFTAWVGMTQPELAIPDLADKGETASKQHLRELLLLQAFRPDRVGIKAQQYVSHIFGDDFLPAGQTDFTEFVDLIDPRTPFLLCGVKGYDASANVLDFAAERSVQVKQIAIGSKAGFAAAKAAVEKGKQNGHWVLLTNVHLAPKWLESVAKELVTGTTPNSKFRLFMTSDITPKLPNVLIRMANVQVFEAAPGVRANLQRTLLSFPETQVDAAPAERGRLFFLLAWLNAVIQERIRYAPLGWSKAYEFGDPDLKAAAETIDTWMTDAAKGRSNLPADKIPFPALQTLLSKAIYGGRVDNIIDERLLESFVKSVFCEEAYGNFELVPGTDGSPAITVPDGSKRADFLKWSRDLPKTQLPLWIGLPNNAERVLMTVRSRTLTANMLKLQSTDDGTADEGDAEKNARPAWMNTLAADATKWLAALPESLDDLQRNANSVKDPLHRFFAREITVVDKLLKQVRGDLTDLQDVCAGTLKQTNYLRGLIETLIKGSIFAPWKKYKFPSNLMVDGWIADFAVRLKQYARVTKHVADGQNLQEVHLWLGGLLVPEAFFTASKQAVAQAHGWSLEQLRLELETIPAPQSLSNTEFLCTELRFEGAAADGSTVEFMDATFKNAQFIILRWTMDAPKWKPEESINMPIYLNCTREHLLATVDFKGKAGMAQHTFNQRGVGIMCSSLQ
jgi:dynein heavy chain 1